MVKKKEIEKEYSVVDFLEAIRANVATPGETELDHLWRWLLIKRQSHHSTLDLAMYMKDRFKDDWYLTNISKLKKDPREKLVTKRIVPRYPKKYSNDSSTD